MRRVIISFFTALLLVFPAFAANMLVRLSDLHVVDAVAEGLDHPFVAQTLDDMVAARTNGAIVVEQREIFWDSATIPLHDAGVRTIFAWTGDAAQLNAARDIGVKYVRTDRPDEAIRLVNGFRDREKRPVTAAEFRVRDPYILADPVTRMYYLYETTAPFFGPPYARGVCVRSSKDLVTWSPLKSVMNVPVSYRARTVWAPEVHYYRGRYWMFTTITQYPREDVKLPHLGKNPRFRMPEIHRPGRRGVWVYVADSPEGPFKPTADRAVTPEDWISLDGSFVEDEGRPYMVFCHEWLQTEIGRVDCAPLSDDLTRFTEPPRVLFDAFAAPGENRVTDGCFCYRSKSGKLFMIWSKFVPGCRYSVILTESANGRVTGPWTNQHVIYGRNGGHAMILRTFEGDLKLVLHGPELRGWEHLRIFDLEDTGDDLVVHEPSEPKGTSK